MSEEQTSFLVLFHAFETVFTPSIIFVNFRAFELPTERCLAIAYVYDQSFMQRAHELRFVQEADQRLFFLSSKLTLAFFFDFVFVFLWFLFCLFVFVFFITLCIWFNCRCYDYTTIKFMTS